MIGVDGQITNMKNNGGGFTLKVGQTQMKQNFSSPSV